MFFLSVAFFTTAVLRKRQKRTVGRLRHKGDHVRFAVDSAISSFSKRAREDILSNKASEHFFRLFEFFKSTPKTERTADDKLPKKNYKYILGKHIPFIIIRLQSTQKHNITSAKSKF